MKRYFYTVNPIYEVEIRKYRSIRKYDNKPNGFWYSCGKSWFNFFTSEIVRTEAAGIPEAQYKFQYEVSVDLNEILVIRNMNDMNDFYQNFVTIPRPKTRSVEKTKILSRLAQGIQTV